MNIVRFGKDAFKKTIGVPQQVARFLGNQDSRRAASMQNALQGAPVVGNKIDFAEQTEQLKEAAQQGPQQPGMGRKVLTSFLDYTNSPEGRQTLIDLASLAVASGQSDPYVSGAMASGVQERIKQRPILEQQRLAREQAAADREMDKKLKDALLNQRTTQADKNKFDTTPKGFKPATGFTLANPDQNFIDDPRAKELGLIQTNLETGDKYVNADKIPDYLDKKDLAKINLESNIEQAKIRNEQINKIVKNPKLSKIIGTKGIGPFNIAKEFIQSIGGTSQEINTLIESINTQSADKILETLKKLKSQSRTGATGFGALNAPELQVITNAFFNLNKAQDRNTFVTNIKKIDEVFSNATEREQRNYFGKYIDEDIELYQNPYKKVTTETETQEEIESQPQRAKSGVSWRFP